ncbi:MAG: aminopeptidase P family protein [archaeon]|nr:aminopeptidase P family protein [archaeon]
MARLRAHPGLAGKRAIVLLQGGEQGHLYDTDVEPVFRQESFFHWLFGVREPDFLGALDVESGAATLFAPLLDPSYEVWCGALKGPEEIRQQYLVQEVVMVDQEQPGLPQLGAWLEDRKQQAVFLTLRGVNSDSGRQAIELTSSRVPSLANCTVEASVLWGEMSDLRAVKTAAEVEVLRYVCRVSSEAHDEVMRRARPGMMEYQLESLFRHFVYAAGGCRHVGYTCICCSGPNAAILHYGHAAAPNDRQFKEGDIMMLDMGGEYGCYTADISCSWPASGRFSPLQKAVYEAVAAAQRAVISAMRPGASWPDLHLLAEEVLLTHLQSPPLSVIPAAADLSAARSARLAAVFMPHGLGHLLGIDVHDAGGYLPHTPARSPLAGLKSLRTARLLEAGMVLTVEPGLYFIDCLLDKALADPLLAPFLLPEALQRLRGFGGVRLEDDVLVTPDGAENLTLCPRTTEAVEALMAEGRLKYPRDFVNIQQQFF